MKVQITAVVLTANEKDNIVRCLNSIKWCDEIILIDNSSDRTVELVNGLKLKQLRIIKDDTTDDFASLRNSALKHAKNDWVLFIDADEEVPDKLQKEILNSIQNPQADGYYLSRRDFFLGRWLKFGETGNMKLLKLGRKKVGKWTRPVHEEWQIESTTTLNSYLNHYPHPTIAEFLSRIHRWSTIDAEVFYQQGGRANFLKIILYPIGKFFINYIVRLGFLDGMPGLIMALMMSFHSFLTRAKLYQLNRDSCLKRRDTPDGASRS